MGQTAENEDNIKVKQIHTWNECHIMLIWFIWLKDVELILPKRPSSPKIVYIFSLVNESNFPLKPCLTSSKWAWNVTCLTVFLLMNFLWADLYVKSRSETFSTTCVLFWTRFSWKKIHKIVGTTVQVSRLNAILCLGTERSKCFSGHNMFR